MIDNAARAAAYDLNDLVSTVKYLSGLRRLRHPKPSSLTEGARDYAPVALDCQRTNTPNYLSAYCYALLQVLSSIQANIKAPPFQWVMPPKV
jgi:hypothetical protein